MESYPEHAAGKGQTSDEDGDRQLLFELAGDMLCVAGLDGYFKVVNPAFGRVLGYTEKELLERPYLELLHPDDVDATIAEIGRLGSGEDSVDFENRYLRADGAYVWLQWSSRVGPNGLVFGVARDVTESRRTHALLRETERTANIGGWELNFGTGELFWTEQTYKMHEVDPETFTPTLEAAVGFYSPESLPLIAEALEVGKRTGKPWDLELQIVTAKGRKLDVRAVGQVEMAHGEAVRSYGSFQDVTDRRRLEEELLHSQKLEGIGRLAGGVAHDFNNLLTAIVGNVDLLESLPDLGPEAQSYLAGVAQAAEQARHVTKQLLAFARKQVREPRLVNLGERVSELSDVLDRLLADDIRFVTTVEDSTRLVLIDPGHFELVLVNLAVNASDAIGGAGRLSIEVRDVDGPIGPPIDAPDGSYVEVLVSDDGTGITPEVLPYLFEPFFTTKEMGKGTGLGLSTCHGIVEQNGGRIVVVSEVGEGTTFRLLFPAVAVGESTPHERTADGASGPSSGSGVLVLLVEDEPLVRKVTQEILERSGYTVVAAEDGGSALELAAKHAGDIEAIITDVILPGRNGLEVVEAVRELLGPLPALYVSGYHGDHLGRSTLEGDHGPLLQKPFSASALVQAVGQLLGQCRR